SGFPARAHHCAIRTPDGRGNELSETLRAVCLTRRRTGIRTVRKTPDDIHLAHSALLCPVRLVAAHRWSTSKIFGSAKNLPGWRWG
ncbi:MAG: hypothetical protein ACKPJD_11045, partial [Planctomycetaceae bacterium]